MDLVALADSAWKHDGPLVSTRDPGLEVAEVGEGTAFVPSFANVSAVATDDGLVLVDTGGWHLAEKAYEQLRHWSKDPVHTAVFTHGHIDHVFGMERYEADAEAAGAARPRVVAHEAVDARFDRYRLTAGYNGVINQRQFSLPRPTWPTEFRRPDLTYRDRLDLQIGGARFELHHGKGETDDATWVYVPARKTLLTGDMVIWCIPNAGNPQKVQRYPVEWAQALRNMDTLGAELLLPGHGLPIFGAERVHQLLDETATMLESLVEQALSLLNEGARLDELIHSVKPPADLINRAYLRPVYDEPEFVVHNIWRLYGGWYDGNPAHLKPAPDGALALELAGLAGGASTLADRALALAAQGDDASMRLAGHLAEMAAQAAPDDEGVLQARSQVFAARAKVETSLMARGIFAAAARET